MKSTNAYLVAPGRAELREEPIAAPGPNEVQVRTLANGICMMEVSLFTGVEPSGYPRLLGHEGVGRVVAVGSEVRDVLCSNLLSHTS